MQISSKEIDKKEDQVTYAWKKCGEVRWMGSSKYCKVL